MSSAKFTGIDPENHLTELEFVLATISKNPLKSTVSSREIADKLDCRQNQATAILNHAEQHGLVERWSSDNHGNNPKWLVHIDDGGTR